MVNLLQNNRRNPMTGEDDLPQKCSSFSSSVPSTKTSCSGRPPTPYGGTTRRRFKWTPISSAPPTDSWLPSLTKRGIMNCCGWFGAGPHTGGAIRGGSGIHSGVPLAVVERCPEFTMTTFPRDGRRRKRWLPLRISHAETEVGGIWLGIDLYNQESVMQARANAA
jgi:hypothetical protein